MRTVKDSESSLNNSEYPEQDEISGVKKTQAPVYGVGDSTLQAAGGEQGVKKLVDAFYYYMDTIPVAAKVRAMHNPDLSESKAKLTTFLIGWMGGPSRYAELYGSINIPGAHSHLDIGLEEKNAWLLCMQKALDDQPYEETFKRYVMVQLSFPAEMCRNRR